jgi:predicted nucleic acid-binding protein
MGSVLIAARRDKRISAAKLSAAQIALRALGVETLAIELEAAELIDLSQRYHMQGYDVVYFELARRLAIPIASIDGGIKTACKSFDVKML